MKFPLFVLLLLTIIATAQESQPRVAIIHDRQIDIVNLSGEIEYTINSESYSFISAVVWSPDGQAIAFDVANETFITDIRIQHIADGTSVMIGNADTADTPITWHPTRGLTYEAQIRRDTRTIMTYNLLTDEYTTLTKTLPEYADRVQAHSPAWSPDGRYLAYLYGPKNTNNAVIIQDLEMDTYQAVQSDLVLYPDYLHWIDNDTLLFTASCDILLYKLDSKSIIDLTIGGYCEGYPAVSSDGRIAYVNGNYQLWLMDNPQAIIELVSDPNKDGFFFWNPDGVLTFTDRKTSAETVYDNLARLLTEQQVLPHTLQWLSNEQFAFVTAADGDNDIYVLDLTSNQITNLTNNDIDDSFFAWWIPPEATP
jgi:Tol biopolymer transport system component